MTWLLFIAAYAGACVWAAGALVLALRLRALPVLEEQDGPPAAALPTLSVVLPAHDEVACLRRTAESFLAQRGVSLQLVLVDDRSQDGTGALMDELARADARVTALHLDAVPAGWLGKVHALQRGLERATGELVLFSDAGVELAPEALARVLRLCVDGSLDHVAILPAVEPRTAWLAVLSDTVKLGLVAWLSPQGARFAPRRYLGVGPFNLVRREALAATAGLAWLRLELLDDLGLGLLMHQPQLRRLYLVSRGEVSLRWYDSAGDMILGLEKSAFALLARFAPARAAVVLAALVLLPLWPVAVAAAGPEAWGAGVLAAALWVFVTRLAHRRLGGSWTSLLRVPAGMLLLAVALLRSAWRFYREDGVRWGGLWRSAAELRRGQRVRP